MYSWILRNSVYPVMQMRFPPKERFISYLRLLEKTQWWNSIDLEKFQQKKLQLLLKHAYENVPYYHRTFNELGLKPQDIKNSTDLQKLPILTKDIIRKNLNDLVPRNFSQNKLIPYSTSGSTSEPLRFFIDRQRYAQNMGAAYREWGWAGYNIGDKIAYLWGEPHDLLKNARPKAKLLNFIQNKIILNTSYLDEKNLDKYVKILRKFKPKIINSYTSPIFLLALYIEKTGIKDIKPKSILTTAEMLFDYQRKTIEKAFECKIFDYYSGRDTSLQAGECPKHFGYHLAIENAVVEFIKENQLVSPGETGEIILTDLCNYAVPFIRYEMGDLGVPSDESCPCGRNLPIMKSLKGRIFDFIITPEGKYIPGERFHSIILNYDIHGIKEFQILQKSIDKITVNIVENSYEMINDINRFINLIQKEVGENIEIELKNVTSIKRTSSGKLRSTISYVNKLSRAINKDELEK